MSSFTTKRQQWNSATKSTSVQIPILTELWRRANKISSIQAPFTYAEYLEYHSTVYAPGLRALRDLYERTSNLELLIELIDKLNYPDSADYAKLFMSRTMTEATRKLLLELDADSNILENVTDQHPIGAGVTMLEGAVFNGETQLVKFLVGECGVDVLRGCMTHNGQTPLQWVESRLSARKNAKLQGRDLADPIDDWEPMHKVLKAASDAQLDGGRLVRKPIYPRITREILQACWKAQDEGQVGSDASAEIQRIELAYMDHLEAWRDNMEMVKSELLKDAGSRTT